MQSFLGFASSTRPFDSITLCCQFLHQHIAVIPLDFDYLIFYGAATAAFLLEAFCQFLERVTFQGNSADHRDPLALASLGRAPDPHDSIAPDS